MTLAILSVAYPFAPVGPMAVGGAEQVLSALDRALVRAGHKSIVLACPGSHVSGELVAVGTAEGVLTEERRRAERQRVSAVLQRVVSTRHVDVIHFHGVDFCEYLPPGKTPVLATLHLPPSWYPESAYRPRRPHTYLSCVSRTQRDACPPGAAVVATIENGVPLDVLRPEGRKGRFALALGRICAEKGFHLALAAAEIAGLPLLLAGSVFPYPEHQDYFTREILPRLSGARRFIGSVNLQRKRHLLAAARCLLIPSLAPETSSLVAMEALACGTPVIAFRAGALPEIITHGRTGFLVEDEREMARAIREVDAIDPQVCRQTAEACFDSHRMCRQYTALLAALTESAPPDATSEARLEATCARR